LTSGLLQKKNLTNDQYLIKNSHVVSVTDVFDRARYILPPTVVVMLRGSAHAVQTNCILWSKRHY